MPDQTGVTVVVTGANSGLGEAAARELAAHGAAVVLACRNVVKAERVAADIAGEVAVRQLDLADLASVRAFAAATGPIDVLINNAGIMAVPKRRTADGFESQIGTNFLGPFALTGLLLGRIADRVVTVTSFGHRGGRINLNDLNWRQRRYETVVGLRAVQARRPDVHLRARPAAARGGFARSDRSPRIRATRPPSCSRTPSRSRTR